MNDKRNEELIYASVVSLAIGIAFGGALVYLILKAII